MSPICSHDLLLFCTNCVGCLFITFSVLPKLETTSYELNLPSGLDLYLLQGVRREVGNHAKVLNKVLDHSVPTKDTDDVIDTQSGTSYPRSLESLGQILSKEAGSISSKPTNSSLLLQPDDKRRQTSQAVLSTEQADVEEERTTDNLIPLKESIGHTEIEVIAGALLGFFVSLAVYTIM